MIEKVVLIDDDEINNFICVNIMKKTGFAKEVKAFESAVEALEYFGDLAKNHADEMPNAIFLDINMPLMNGWDFLDSYNLLISEISNPPKVLMLSSSIYQADVEKSSKYQHVVDFVTKPLKEESLNEIKHKYF